MEKGNNETKNEIAIINKSVEETDEQLNQTLTNCEILSDYANFILADPGMLENIKDSNVRTKIMMTLKDCRETLDYVIKENVRNYILLIEGQVKLLESKLSDKNKKDAEEVIKVANDILDSNDIGEIIIAKEELKEYYTSLLFAFTPNLTGTKQL